VTSRRISLAAPFRDLTDFPALRVADGTPVWRVVAESHREEPWRFGCSGDGRFDLHRHGPAGTCYVAATPPAALVEAAAPQSASSPPILTAAVFRERHLQQVPMPATERIADTRARRVAGYGVTAELGTVIPYTLPQWWAQALHHRGFAGVRYEPRHAVGDTAFALFGPRGTRGGAGIISELDAATLRALLEPVGVKVLGPPLRRDALDVVDP